MIAWLDNHFGKRTASSPLYFLSYAYFDIYEIMKFADSHVILPHVQFQQNMHYPILPHVQFQQKYELATLGSCTVETPFNKQQFHKNYWPKKYSQD